MQFKKYWHDSKVYQDYLDSKLNEQDNCCAVCEIEFSYKDRKLRSPFMDHDHLSNEIRGIVCISCNLLIGRVENGKTNINNLSLEMQASLRNYFNKYNK